MNLDWTRWALYMAVGPPFFLMLFMLRPRYFKTVLLLLMLVFVEMVFLTWRPIGYIAFSLTSAMGYVILASLLTQPDARRNMLAQSFPWVLFLASALVGMLIGSTSRVSDGPTNWLYFQQYYLEGILFFWIGRTAVRDGAECERVLHWLILFGGGAAILHYFSLATGYTFYASSGQDMLGPEGWRYGGVFTNPNSLADFYAVVLPIALICRMGWSRPSVRTGVLILASAAMMVGSLALTGSRGGSGAAIAALALGVLLLPIGFRSSIGWFFFAGLTLVVAYLTVTNVVEGGLELTLERFQGKGLSDIRYQVWSMTIASILDHPLGIGLDPYIFGDSVRVAGVRGAHNTYLEIASQIGILGLVAFLWIIGASMAGLWRARRSSSPHAKTAATALFVGLFAFLLAGIVEPVYHNGVKFQRIFWILMGIGSAAPVWAGLRKPVKEPDPGELTTFTPHTQPALRGRPIS